MVVSIICYMKLLCNGNRENQIWTPLFQDLEKLFLGYQGSVTCLLVWESFYIMLYTLFFSTSATCITPPSESLFIYPLITFIPSNLFESLFEKIPSLIFFRLILSISVRNGIDGINGQSPTFPFNRSLKKLTKAFSPSACLIFKRFRNQEKWISPSSSTEKMIFQSSSLVWMTPRLIIGQNSQSDPIKPSFLTSS